MTRISCFAMSILIALVISCSEPPSGEPVDFAKACDSQNNGKMIQLSGYLSEKGSVWCRNFSGETKCGFKLLESPGSEASIDADLIEGSSKNMVGKLERDYKPEDVKVRANDGSVINLAEKVKVSGEMLASPENKVCSITVRKIEK